MHIEEIERLRRAACAIADEGGRIALEWYNADTRASISLKPDQSPVTEADIAVDRLITEQLRTLAPGVPVISEESYAPDQPPGYETPYWLVDPIDGTREFIARTGDFTINIALMIDRQPAIGIINVPVANETFSGSPAGAWLRDGVGERAIAVRPWPPEGPTIVSSRYSGKRVRLDEFLLAHGAARHYQRGSSLKFCEVACGRADLFPQFGRIREWDIAAGHAIMRAAGGDVTGLDGNALIYGSANATQPPFVAFCS